MKILILEDNPNRIKQFKYNLIGHDVDITDQVLMAIELLKNNDYDLIFLDHDLEGKHYVPSSYFNTGYTVAKYLSANPQINAKIIIHSSNYKGVAKMRSVLPNARHISFIFLDIGSILNEH